MNRLKLLFALFLFTGFSALMAQTVTIRGTVTSADDGLPIPSASVTVKGATLGTLTDVDGKYVLNVPVSATTLIFNFVGMKKIEEVINSRTTIDIVMATDMLGLDEVVVTALGITREKKALGYSVQDVKGSELANSEESNIVNALQGKIAGVQITKASGAVGSSSQIQIRGIKSFGDNQPLWVVDGTPISNSSTGASQWGTNSASSSSVDFGNNASDIDAENVESISILKGANAAALYGSRARNGVVLVTTKKGSSGKVKVSYSNSTSFDRVGWLPKYQNEYGQGYNGDEYHWLSTAPEMSYQDYASSNGFAYYDGMSNGVNDGVDESWGPRLDAGLLIDQFFGKAQPWVSHPDNIKDFFVTGVSTSNNISLEGGTDFIKSRVGISQSSETGTIPNTDEKKNQISLSSTMTLSPKLKFEVNLNYAQTKNDNLPGQGYTSQNVMESLGGWFGRQIDMKMLKDNWDTFFENGMPYNWNSNFHNNPYWTVNKNTNSRKRERVYGNMLLTYKLTDWLDVVGRYGVDYYYEFRKQVVYEGSNDAGFGSGGYFSQSDRSNKEVNADFMLNFKKDFGTDLQLSGNLGANYRRRDYNFTYVGAKKLTVPNFFDVSNVKGSAVNDMYMLEYESQSAFGSVNVGYKNQLFMDVTGRFDWSSTLPPSSWEYFYPSVSLGWLFTETFPIEGNILSFGKLRGSYAQVGSDTDPYSLYSVYTSSSDLPAYSGTSLYYYPSVISPSGLKPEKSNSYEAGLELKFLNNRIGLDLTLYDILTNNQIIRIPVSGSTGFTSKTINAGEIETKGIELQVYGDIIRKKDFVWTTVVNFAKSRAVLNELYPDINSNVMSSSWSPTTIESRPGEPVAQIYGTAYSRDAKGNKLVENGSFVYDDASYVVIGNAQADWVGSINNQFKYKKFNANVLVDAKFGGDIFSVTKWFGAMSGVTQETVENNIRENGIVADGIDVATNEKNTVVVDAQSYFEAYYGNSESGIIDGSYVKLREINLGYDFNLKSKLISNLNVGLFARNIAVLYLDPSNNLRIDPETAYGTGTTALGYEQYQLPPVRSMGFKLRVDF